MEKKLIITLAILTIISLIIAVGCGDSGDTMINPTSQGNTVNNPENNGAYIKVNITWPQDGIEGKCIISSGNENTLTASMPGGTMQVIVRVRPVPDPNSPTYVDDPNNYLENGYAEILKPEEKVILGPLPAMHVIVRAEAHDRYGPLVANMAISAVEKDFHLQIGQNTTELNLGDYELNLNSSDPFVVPEKDSLDASAGLSQPEVDRMLNWFVERDILDSSGEPPGIINRDIEINANLNITTDPSVPVSGREVTFSLIDPPSDVSLSSTTATTDDNGNCKVTLTTVVPNSPITVEGVFKVEWEDPPGTPVVKEYKDRITINPNIRNILLATKDNDLINIPDFVCDYFKNGVHDSTIRATLKQIDSENYVYPHPTIDGKTIKFTVKDTACSFSPELTLTGAGGVPGEAVSNLNTTSLAFRPIKVTIECLEDPSDPNFILPAPQELTVIVSDNLVFEEDFEKAEYEPGLGTTEFHNVLLAANGWGLSLPLETPLDFIRPEFDIIPYVSIQPRRKPV